MKIIKGKITAEKKELKIAIRWAKSGIKDWQSILHKIESRLRDLNEKK